MAPKRKGGDRVGKKRVKRAKKIMPLSEKVRLLDRLALGESAASVGRLYGVNESTVRYIKKSEVAIRASVSECVPRSARASFYTRDPHMEKMERALNLWIEDQTRMGVPLSGVDIRERALRFYERSAQSSCGDSGNNGSGKKSRTPFAASKGWFENFKKRYSLQNVKLVGESMDTVADEGAYRVLRKKVVDEEEEDDDCKPRQVFDVDEMGLFWKKMPTRTYISKEERSGLKAPPDDGPSLLCANDVPGVPSPLDGDSSRAAGVARTVGAEEGLEDLQGADLVVLIESRTEELPEEDLEERMKAGDGDSDDDGEEGEEENASGKSRLTLKTLAEIMQLGSELTDKVFEADPLVERSVRFKREMDAVLNPYREVYRDLWRKAKQIPITSYLRSHSSAVCDSTTPAKSLPGTSSTKDRPAPPPRDLPEMIRKRDSRRDHHHDDDEHH
ncbi:uncharacterized protein LOC116940493 [Petromyzon marinus]|uniref:uncharacterized protein LOC116940493 n=1 Tax=Petromyzon marinus TaxID=7757 RepID=UPI003F70023D